MNIAYITAGAAGMYCGSCLRDNTLVGALHRLGVDVQLIPTYTPIRTDEQDYSIDRVFYGGINVFLQQRFPPFRYLPALVDRWLDQPWLIRWAAGRGIETSPQQLGDLTVSMLRGSAGHQRKEVQRLVGWLEKSVRPNLINLSNMLIGGCIGALKQALGVPVLVTLQGDDVFLNELPEPYKTQALDEIRRLAGEVDGFLVFSRYYADYMAGYLDIPPEKFHIVQMGVNIADFQDNHPTDQETDGSRRPPTIGYLARLAPAKGLHYLVDAFLRLRERPGLEKARLHIAGWLGEPDRKYADRQFARLRAAGLADAFHYAGAVNRQEKIQFLHGLDVLSVPTTYHEPKGIFVLEALAAGVPVVQPEHGAFPELLASTGGGRLVRPDDPRHLADTLAELLTDPAGRAKLAREGRETVQRDFDSQSMARATLQVYQQYLE